MRAESGKLIHFNNAGSSLPHPKTLEAVQRYLAEEATYGGYEVQDRPHEAAQLQEPYNALAELLHCDAENIAVLNSATAAWQQVFLGLPLWRPGSQVITSVAEYGSNYLAYLQVAKRFGTAIHVINETGDGDIDIRHLEQLLTVPCSGFTLVSISHIPTSSGRVYDAEAVGAAVAKHPGVIYLLDACQSVGQLPLDVDALQCHFLTATGRKFLRGPRGCGFLYASPAALADTRLEPAALDVRSGVWVARGGYEAAAGARRYEEYEMSFAAKVGLGVATRLALNSGLQDGTIWATLQRLAGMLREGLQAMPGVAVHDRGRRLCAIVSFTVEGKSAAEVKAALAAHRSAQFGGINVSVSAAASTRLAFEAQGLQEVVRASPHYYNTEEEVAEVLQAVKALL